MTMPEHLRELIAQRALEDGERIFLTEPDTGRTLCFGALETTAQKLLRGLKSHGFRKGDRVVLIFHNGIQAALAFLSVVTGDGVATPVHPDNTARELRFFLEHSGALFVLTNKDLTLTEKEFAGLSRRGELAEGILLYSYTPGTTNENLPRDLAMLLYTSGTTGTPKGVMLSHRNLLAECAHIQQAHQLTKGDKALCLLPLYHINGLVVTLLTPLFTGLEVVMPPRFSASHLWEWVRKHRVTWFSAVPTIYSILLSQPIPNQAEVSSLRFMRSASSALPKAVLLECERRIGVPLIESYGISEGGSQITTNPLPPATRKPGSVGLPFGNEIRVLQADGGIAPVGAVGEVAVRGENIASAYLNNPKATEESFRNGWFYTGDIGCFDADGYLFLQGRKKELINRAGEMISPLEIDEVLYQHPAVKLAATIGVPHALYGEEVVAFLQMREGETVPKEEVKAFCRDKLMAFKIPKRIYFTDDFPKGPSGKIQRLKLVERYLTLPDDERAV
ncbi:MAG: AMP-binding protein [Candidatus Accumulibacter sp.]|jgi:acyl-CoA synthetase (AMP-forming)/AMP-acid ligase II|nr:AMP-binding protein [Accumulibacter sp.]